MSRLKAIKFFAAGVIFAIMLTSVVVFANEQMRELIFGINISINGQILELDYNDRAFIMEGRTFLPVGIVARELGAEVRWYSPTQTVYISTNQNERTALRHAAPFYARSHGIDGHDSASGVGFQDYAQSNEQTFENALVFTASGNTIAYTLHNLDQRFTTLSLATSLLYGARPIDGIFTFIGDGEIIAQIHSYAHHAEDFVISVQNVSRLRIEFTSLGGDGANFITRHILAAYLQ